MKNLQNFTLIALFVGFFVIWGCDDKEPTPTTTTNTTDTTDNDTTETPTVVLNVGFDKYNVVTDKSFSEANYVSGNDITRVYFIGNSVKTNTPIQIQLEWAGKTTGTFTQTADDVDITVDVENSSSPKYKQYDQDTDSNSEITITEYGAVGEMIKGTFKGRLKANLSGEEISGTFEIVRGADQ
jgi:hypothetical protein